MLLLLIITCSVFGFQGYRQPPAEKGFPITTKCSEPEHEPVKSTTVFKSMNKFQKLVCTVVFMVKKTQKCDDDDKISISNALDILRREKNYANSSIRVAVDLSPNDLRDVVLVLDAIQSANSTEGQLTYYEAKYDFRFAEGLVQDVVNRMFEINLDNPKVIPVPLHDLKLMASKTSKSCVNHRAELYIWIGAHQNADFPRHIPLWLNAENEVLEGSSTFLSLLKNFPPLKYPGLTLPCEYKTGKYTRQ